MNIRKATQSQRIRVYAKMCEQNPHLMGLAESRIEATK